MKVNGKIHDKQNIKFLYIVDFLGKNNNTFPPPKKNGLKLYCRLFWKYVQFFKKWIKKYIWINHTSGLSSYSFFFFGGGCIYGEQSFANFTQHGFLAFILIFKNIN